MQYNNSGYYLLGMVIEKASGQSYADYLAEQLSSNPWACTPHAYGDTRPLIPRRAMAYKRQHGELVNDDPIGMTAPGAAGALVSNVLDLLKPHQRLEAGDFISPGVRRPCTGRRHRLTVRSENTATAGSPARWRGIAN